MAAPTSLMMSATRIVLRPANIASRSMFGMATCANMFVRLCHASTAILYRRCACVNVILSCAIYQSKLKCSCTDRVNLCGCHAPIVEACEVEVKIIHKVGKPLNVEDHAFNDAAPLLNLAPVSV